MKQVLDETRVKWALAVFLALVAGYLDGYGLRVLGTYVSFMSGNTTFAGLKSGQGTFQAALPSAIAIVFFVTGSFLGNFFRQSRLPYSRRLIFGLIAGLLATVVGRHGLWNAPAEIALLSVAMGMMNPALAKVGAESVSLTFVTGTLNRIGGNLAAAAGRKPLTDGQGSGDSYLARARIDASVWLGFLAGAALSGMAASHLHMWALLPPCVVMIALGLFSEDATPSPEKMIASPTSGVGGAE
ncbi:MAG TPA: YoaK family protein [Candidatus Acidoferrum sp.]|nr:YoaK family protein [Candidatus Acidoferrum sp.]